MTRSVEAGWKGHSSIRKKSKGTRRMNHEKGAARRAAISAAGAWERRVAVGRAGRKTGEERKRLSTDSLVFSRKAGAAVCQVKRVETYGLGDWSLSARRGLIAPKTDIFCPRQNTVRSWEPGHPCPHLESGKRRYRLPRGTPT